MKKLIIALAFVSFYSCAKKEVDNVTPSAKSAQTSSAVDSFYVFGFLEGSEPYYYTLIFKTYNKMGEVASIDSTAGKVGAFTMYWTTVQYVGRIKMNLPKNSLTFALDIKVGNTEFSKRLLTNQVKGEIPEFRISKFSNGQKENTAMTSRLINKNNR